MVRVMHGYSLVLRRVRQIGALNVIKHVWGEEAQSLVDLNVQFGVVLVHLGCLLVHLVFACERLVCLSLL